MQSTRSSEVISNSERIILKSLDLNNKLFHITFLQHQPEWDANKEQLLKKQLITFENRVKNLKRETKTNEFLNKITRL